MISGYWEARAIYEDGTEIERMFDYNYDLTENDQVYEIECWLLERHEGCTWYSVDWVNDYDPAEDYWPEREEERPSAIRWII